jgi:hypothetical protein
MNKVTQKVINNLKEFSKEIGYSDDEVNKIDDWNEDEKKRAINYFTEWKKLIKGDE